MVTVGTKSVCTKSGRAVKPGVAVKLVVAMASVSALLIAGACSTPGGDVVYSRFHSVPSGGWAELDGREFQPFAEDTLLQPGRYDVVLCLRHNGSFAFREMRLAVETPGRDGVMMTDTVTVRMADADGRFVGRGSYDLYETADTVLKNVHLERNWSIAVAPAMPGGDVRDIDKIGLILLRR